ncbi:MAG TPA: hypothetical protein VFS15_09290, partial [Kofleriaceae bacterium]|nr:hypothetical protein [Kofleriaceae bacterium]
PKLGLWYEKLAQVNAWQADVDARWLSLVAVEALSTPSADQRQVLAQGRQKLPAPSRVRLGGDAREALRGTARPGTEPADVLGGPLHELWLAISPAVQVATGVDIGKLGFSRGDRIAMKKLGDRYEPLVTALTAFNVDDVDIYINAGRTGMARALAADTPILCLGADVAAASTPQTRFSLGRVVATVAEGVAALPHLRDGELAWTIAAALRAVDAPLPPALADQVAGEDNSIAERAKLLKKELGRRAKATVLELARSKPDDIVAVDALRRAAIAVAWRAGLLWCGDLAVALAVLDVGKGGRALMDSQPALDLTAWSVSDAHLALRELVGMTLRGMR